MIEADTPSLWELRGQLGEPAAIAILIKAFIHTARLASINEKNLSDIQMGEAAKDIIECHGQLKVEEIKYLLKRGIRTEKLYGRFDYNVIMNWVEAYSEERLEEAIRSSEQHESEQINNVTPSAGAVTYQQWVEQLRGRAPTDKSAAEMLKMIGETPHTPEDIARHTDCKTDIDAKDNNQ